MAAHSLPGARQILPWRVGCSLGKDLVLYKKTQGLPTAPYVHTLKQQFKVTHPFHPLYSREFTLLVYRRSWGRTYVEYLDAQGKAGAMPLEWTDAAPPDLFVSISATRAVFRVEELLRLKQWVDSMKGEENECK